MPLCSRPPGAARGLAAATATTIAAVTLAAITMASPGRAQTTPGAGEPEAPQPGIEAPPSATGQAPAASAPAPAATPTPPPSGQTAGAPPLRRPLAQNRPGGSATVAAKVNLRRGPDTDSEILTTIPAGAAVHAGECDGEWCKVIWNGHSGFAIARNLNFGGPRQAGLYPGRPGGPGYPDDYGYGPGYYGPPAVYGAPAYYYGPRVYYYGRPWGWRRYW